MPPHPELEFVSRTDTGRVRTHNEDTVAVSAAHRLAILADGMGGYAAGEIASGIAATVIRQTIENRLNKRGWRRQPPRASSLQHLLATAVELANDAILATAQRQPEYAGMGTTLVAALFHHNQVSIAHVGDSRAYRIRRGRIEQLTHDHSLLQEQLDAGLISSDQARFATNKNMVTRAVGIQSALQVETHAHPIAAADIYLLCSDGLSDLLTDPEILAAISAASDLVDAAERLVQRANENGGNDNISVILIRVKSEHPARSELLGYLANWIK